MIVEADKPMIIIGRNKVFTCRQLMNFIEQRPCFIKLLEVKITIAHLEFSICNFFIADIIEPCIFVVVNCFLKFIFLKIIPSQVITHQLRTWCIVYPVDVLSRLFHCNRQHKFKPANNVIIIYIIV